MTGIPFQLNSITGCAASKSHRSWWTIWKNHCNSPVVASSATMLSEYRLAPSRLTPSEASPGLPTEKYTIFEGWIERGGLPNPSPLDGITGPRIGVTGVETPQELPRRRVVGIQMTAKPQSTSTYRGPAAGKHFWHSSLTGADELRSRAYATVRVDLRFPGKRTGLCN